MPEPSAEKPADPNDLTSMSRPPDVHRTTTKPDEQPEPDPSGSTTEPDPATHEEHLRSSGKLKGGAAGGPG